MYAPSGLRRVIAVGGTLILAGAGLVIGSTGVLASQTADSTSFAMVRSAASVQAGCLKYARATVSIASTGPSEVMRVTAAYLPPNTDFDLFVIQVPNAPFGVSWYQGDLESNAKGFARGTFIGRFSIETFAVAPGVANAPVVHKGKDAWKNPAFMPVHTFHLGLWFNSPKDAVKAGCLGATTPFNGDHTAGVQALSTRNFPDLKGPLSRVRP